MSDAIYTPSGDYSIQASWLVAPTSPTTHYDKVHEYPTPDDAASTLSPGAAGNDIYNLTLVSGSAGSGTISKVSVYIRIYNSGNVGLATPVINPSGGTYLGTQITATSTWTTYHTDWATNPYTGVAWTWSDIATLKAGVKLDPNGGKTSLYCTQVYVDVNYTASSPADVSDTPSTYDFGVLNASSSAATGLTNFTITNNSAFTINITISGTDMTGGNTWTLADDGNAGNMIVAIKAGLSGGSYNIIVKKTAPYNTLIAGLAGSGTQQWGMTLYAPTVFTDGVQKTGTITLTAVAA
jgi:hypothetical protein